jgi:hypothetical protein
MMIRGTLFDLKGILEIIIHLVYVDSINMTEQDVTEYEERKAKADRALGNLRMLDAHVDAEYASALQLLESEKRTQIERLKRCS